MNRAAALVFAAVAVSGCATAFPGRPKPTPDVGIDDCPAAASSDLLSVDALQCWFPARHGRWRTLSHDSHFDVLVVQVEALDVRDAASIAAAFAADHGAMFSEILIYVHEPARSGPVRTRRVRWTKTAPLEVFDFTAPAS